MSATVYFVTMTIAVVLAWILGMGMMRDHDASEFGLAFGCGRHYASNYDPADDPTDENSKCYPSYKAWEKSEQWPRPR
jgi:hypothetical protein